MRSYILQAVIFQDLQSKGQCAMDAVGRMKSVGLLGPRQCWLFISLHIGT